jgi:hypothetical protein
MTININRLYTFETNKTIYPSIRYFLLNYKHDFVHWTSQVIDQFSQLFN